MRQQPLKSKSVLKAKSPIKKVSGKPKKKPSLPSISKLKKEAHRVHSLATRLRFAEKRNGELVAQCVTCTNPEWKLIKILQCGHFMSRQFNSTTYSEENTAPQCYGCNVMQQGKQYAFGMWLDKTYGEGTAARLYEEAHTPHQFKRDELLQIIEDRKATIAHYERELNA